MYFKFGLYCGSKMMEESIEKDRPRRQHNLMQFTDVEGDLEDETQDTDMEFIAPRTVKKGKKQQSRSESAIIELEIANKRLVIEKERLRIEAQERERKCEQEAQERYRNREHELKIRELDLEMEKLKTQKTEAEQVNISSPFKIKLQTYSHAAKEDILTYLAEFDAITSQAKWSEDMKVFQLRTLLTGEAREVAQQAGKNYENLQKSLVDRFGEKPYEYFNKLFSLRKDDKETHRGLMARIEQYISRFVGDINPI